MKQGVIWFIRGYQLFLSPIINMLVGGSLGCRFTPTCSEYAREVITREGVLRGIPLALKRLLSCQPFGKPYGTTV